VTYSQARGIFGFTGESSIGQVGFPAVQVGEALHACVRACPCWVAAERSMC
jgi:tryptophanyl-tRNA synthetase